MLIRDAVKAFMEDSVHDGAAQATVYYYKTLLNKLSKLSGDTDMTEVTSETMKTWPKTCAFMRGVQRLYNFFEVKKPKGFKVPQCGRRERLPTRQEFRLLRRFCPALRHLLWVCWHTGARPAELRLLRWQEVFFSERCLILTIFKSKGVRLDGAQTRTIALPKVVHRVLAYWHRNEEPQPTDFVFLNWRGKPWTANAIRSSMKRGVDMAGLPRGNNGERIHAYSFRHRFATDFATRMLDAGVNDITLLADVMGHTDLETTRRYIHRKPKHLVAAVDRTFKRPAQK